MHILGKTEEEKEEKKANRRPHSKNNCHIFNINTLLCLHIYLKDKRLDVYLFNFSRVKK